MGSTLKGDTKGENFRCLVDYLKEHHAPLGNIIAVATDGAPAMVGHYRGSAALLKEKNSNVHTVNCVLQTPSCSQET